MIADSEKRDAGRAVADEAEEGFEVVDGGGIEQIGHSFGEGSDHREHHLPGYSAQVISSRRPFHNLHIQPPYLSGFQVPPTPQGLSSPVGPPVILISSLLASLTAE